MSTTNVGKFCDVIDADLSYAHDILHHSWMSRSKVAIQLLVKPLQWVVRPIENFVGRQVRVASPVNVPVFGIVLRHPCRYKVFPKAVKFHFVLSFIKLLANVRNAFVLNVFDWNDCQYVEESISVHQSSYLVAWYIFNSSNFLRIACFQ